MQSILLSVYLLGLLFFGVGIAPVGIVDQPVLFFLHLLFNFEKSEKNDVLIAILSELLTRVLIKKKHFYQAYWAFRGPHEVLHHGQSLYDVIGVKYHKRLAKNLLSIIFKQNLTFYGNCATRDVTEDI